MIRKSCEKSKKLIEKVRKMFIKSKTRKISIHDADVVSEEENEVRKLDFGPSTYSNYGTRWTIDFAFT